MIRRNKSKSLNKPQEFRFNRHLSVGNNDASDDKMFLEETFLDTGELEALEDIRNKRWIVLGRTGSGKSTLLDQLFSEHTQCIHIKPEMLALNYLSDSRLLSYLSSLGVRLDSFFGALWRHVFITEIMKAKYKLNHTMDIKEVYRRIPDAILRDEKKKRLVDYWANFGDRFWISTEKSIEEFTRTIEKSMNTSLDINLQTKLRGIFELMAAGKFEKGKIETDVEREAFIQHGREAVSSVQIREINELLSIVNDDILTDYFNPVYITVDDLDKDFISGEMKYRMIKSLIEAARECNNKVKNLKIVMALREDMVDRVYRHIDDEGFQEEKFESLYLNLKWNESELEELLDLRVRKMVDLRKIEKKIGLRDLIPVNVGRDEDAFAYMAKRTMLRPRDIITFFNMCMTAATGKEKISADDIRKAELRFSESRMTALRDEWKVDYPNILILIAVLKKMPASFKIIEDGLENTLSVTIDEALTHRDAKNPDHSYLELTKLHDTGEQRLKVIKFLEFLYKFGVIGIRNDHYRGIQWSFKQEKYPLSEIHDETLYIIHPCIWSILGIKPIQMKSL